MILGENHNLSISSPYMNFTKLYFNQLLKKSTTTTTTTNYTTTNGEATKITIITASPAANGWYKATGPASVIAPLYAEIERQVFKIIQKSGQQDHIRLREYIREGWTFHGKGMWATAINQSLPYMVLIGSPNFGGRSVEKDLESQVIILTENNTLREKIEEERKYIWKDSVEVNDDTFKPPERKPTLFIRILSYVVRNFM